MLKRLLLHSESMKKGCKITYLTSDQGIYFIENLTVKRNSIHLLKWIVKNGNKNTKSLSIFWHWLFISIFVIKSEMMQKMCRVCYITRR